MDNAKKVYAWALYDWANSSFATTVMAGFFPLFFKEYWSQGANPTDSTFKLGMANSVASVIVAAMSPVLGAIADKGGVKKKFLMFFTVLGVVMSGGLFFVAQGAWMAAAALFVLASIGFSGGMSFYDALIVDVAEARKMDLVSAIGYGAGYLGGGLLFTFNVAMYLKPHLFGLADGAEAVRVSFILVALWWAVFSVPLFLLVPEPRVEHGRSMGQLAMDGFRQLGETLRVMGRLKTLFTFLVGYWLYIDGVDTVIRMAVDYGMSLGFDSSSLIVALLITQFVGFPAAIIFGKVGEKLGSKTGIYLGIGVYVGVTIWGYFLQTVEQFYGMAVAIGLVQGGVQSLSRSIYARLIPQTKAAEFFGLYNMLGKFAAVIGPMLMGWVALATGNPRHGILSIIILFAAGGALLWFVDVSKGEAAARELDAQANAQVSN
ncbi:MAG: MFS transporter [Myxococcota bacterium]